MNLFLFFIQLIYFSYAAHEFVLDEKISIEEAALLYENAVFDSQLPLTMNDQVLEQLNRQLKNSGGRRHLRLCLKRMKKYAPFISKKLKARGLPLELLVIPL